GDRDVLRADLGAALGDVAQADAVLLAQGRDAVLHVERMHLECGHVDQEPRSDEIVVPPMLPEYVADILAEETLDALPEFLNPVDIGLIHPPSSIRSIGGAWLERVDARLDPKVPGDVGDEVLDRRERPHRLYRNRLVERQLAEPRHAHKARIPVHLGG